ncbi:uncharacterized protein VTP21DRAFT_4826 [Calcarisporiella thermophila]|uniref:uncharacterized protein n=1 Tax=Calcarisporiella thermophila TaxID=911321 RepID=UPI003743A733
MTIMSLDHISWLYIFQASSMSSHRIYEFSSALFISHLFPETLLPTSLYGFALTLCTIITSKWIGKYIDGKPRLNVVRTCCLLQEFSKVISCLLFALLFSPFARNSSFLTHFIFLVILLLGCAMRTSFTGMSIAIDKDWVVVITNSTTVPDNTLIVNAKMRRIDLLGKSLVPFVIAGLSALGKTIVLSLPILIIWCLATIWIEWVATRKLYEYFPALAIAKSKQASKDIGANGIESSIEQSEAAIDEDIPLFYGQVDAIETEDSNKCHDRAGNWWDNTLRDWTMFYSHPVFLSSVSLSMIYVNTLTLNGPLITFLKYHDVTDPTIALVRGFSVLVGVLATYLMPIGVKYLGLLETGISSLLLEFTALFSVLLYLSFASLELNNSTNSTVFFAGLIISRLGYWSFELVQLRVLQELVPNYLVGLFSGQQAILCGFFELIHYGLTIIWKNPKTFVIPAITGVSAVAVSCIVYTIFFKRYKKTFPV